MPALLMGNFYFEHELQSADFNSSRAMQRLSTELSWHLTALASIDDAVWLPEIPTPEFLEHWTQRTGGCRIAPQLSETTQSFEAKPWGWSGRMRRLAEQHRLAISSPSPEAVLKANSRRWSVELEQRLDLQLAGSFVVTNLPDFERELQSRFRDRPKARWLVKADFGMSARERVVGLGPNLDATTARWIEKRLARSDWLVFEPWLDRIAEAGVLLQVPRLDAASPAPQLVAVTELITDERGQYRGTRISPLGNESSWQPALDAALQVARELQIAGYFGPVGIDAMQYRRASHWTNSEIRGARFHRAEHAENVLHEMPQSANSVAATCEAEVCIRPIQDINARWTMGFLATHLARRLAPDEHAAWLLLPTETLCRHCGITPGPDAEHLLLSQFGLDLRDAWVTTDGPVRVLRTSPVWLGQQLTRNVGVLIASPDRQVMKRAVDELVSAVGRTSRPSETVTD